MKEFCVLVTCSVCGETFDSDYKLTKHMSNSHPQPEKTGWMGGGGEGEHSCSCGGGHSSMSDHHHHDE